MGEHLDAVELAFKLQKRYGEGTREWALATVE